MCIYFYDAFIIKKIIKMVFLFSVNTYVYNPMMLFIINIYVFITMIQITLYMLSHLKNLKLAALKEKNIKLIFRLKAQKQMFKQKLKESHNIARQEKQNLMKKNCLKAETYIRFLFSRVPRQARETERKKLQNL